MATQQGLRCDSIHMYHACRMSSEEEGNGYHRDVIACRAFHRKKVMTKSVCTQTSPIQTKIYKNVQTSPIQTSSGVPKGMKTGLHAKLVDRHGSRLKMAIKYEQGEHRDTREVGPWYETNPVTIDEDIIDAEEMQSINQSIEESRQAQDFATGSPVPDSLVSKRPIKESDTQRQQFKCPHLGCLGATFKLRKTLTQHMRSCRFRCNGVASQSQEEHDSDDSYSPSRSQNSELSCDAQETLSITSTQREQEQDFVFLTQPCGMEPLAAKREHKRLKTNTYGVTYKRSFEEVHEEDRKDSESDTTEEDDSGSELQLTQGDVHFIDDSNANTGNLHKNNAARDENEMEECAQLGTPGQTEHPILDTMGLDLDF